MNITKSKLRTAAAAFALGLLLVAGDFAYNNPIKMLFINVLKVVSYVVWRFMPRKPKLPKSDNTFGLISICLMSSLRAKCAMKACVTILTRFATTQVLSPRLIRILILWFMRLKLKIFCRKQAISNAPLR